MKNLYLRSCFVLACALGLAACGGGDDNLTIGGTVYGLTKTGLTLKNNGGPALAVAANAGSFVFPETVSSDSHYNVTVETSPAGALCKASRNTGNTGSRSVVSIVIVCENEKRDLGGNIFGLKVGEKIVILNGSDRKEVTGTLNVATCDQTDPATCVAEPFKMTILAADNTTYVSGRVPDGSAYGITVLTPPAGKSCAVVDGVGTMGATAVSNVKITCTAP
jgi:hypothetical protein